MSVASSTTPWIGENSCSTPSILTAVTAAPSIDDSSTRRMRVADRRAEAALERLRVEPAEPIREGLALELEPLGTLKTFPQHVTVLSLVAISGHQTCCDIAGLPPQV